MNGRLADEAIEIGAVVRDSIEAHGGVDVLRRAVADPTTRCEAGALLDELGIWELDPHSDPVELEAAALVCHAAGFDALPYPVAERLAGGTRGPVVLVAREGDRMGMHLDLDLRWRAVDIDGRPYEIVGTGAVMRSPLAPFGAVVEVDAAEGDAVRDAALLLTLQSWWLLGLLEHATADAVEYTRQREQFGRPLIRFQAVGVRLADMRVAAQSLRELAKYCLWIFAWDVDGGQALTEALALRTASLEAAGEVMRGAHQLYGAMGFTDEVDVSWLSRASQAVRRLPEGEHSTRGALVARIEASGWAEYGQAPNGSVERAVPLGV